jgi:cobalt-zinc-cadmium efflux system outer membrane protein
LRSWPNAISPKGIYRFPIENEKGFFMHKETLSPINSLRSTKTLVTAVSLVVTILSSNVLLAAIDTRKPITFEQAYQIALEHSPQAKLLNAQLEVAEGQVEQAKLKPNPTLGVEIENILGTGTYKGLDTTEVTVGISQLVERGKKRKRRAELAIRSKELFKWDYEEALASLRYEVRQAFSQVLIAQQNVELQHELFELAQESEVEVERRANAARASAIELSQAKLATQQQAFQLHRSERELFEAQTSLTSLWNEPDLVNFKLIGQLELETSLPNFSEMRDLINDTPSLARFEAELAAQEAVINLERARAKADYEIFAGTRYIREKGGDNAFVLGIDMPLRIRDRNQGNIRSAIAGLSVVESRRQLAHRKALTSLSVTYLDLSNTLEELRSLQDELLPFAKAALDETQSGYEQGAITLLNVLEARKALFEIRTAMLDATQQYLTAQAQIERLTRPSSLIHKATR